MAGGLLMGCLIGGRALEGGAHQERRRLFAQGGPARRLHHLLLLLKSMLALERRGCATAATYVIGSVTMPAPAPGLYIMRELLA